MSVSIADEVFACPGCLGPLSVDPAGAACAACNLTYRRRPAGFLDLRIEDRRYKDWLSADDERYEEWRNGPALTEAAGARHMIQGFLTPLLERLHLLDDPKVLSVGCGGGWDVEALHRAGFPAWGIDNGSRVRVWEEHACVSFLSLSDALQMPFPDSTFDLVFSEGVIEHIGCPGDSLFVMEDYRQQRREFAQSLMRVTKPGGYVLVACPNRLFPIDFFHGGRLLPGGLRLRFHSPSEGFLLSYGDLRSLFGAETESIRPLSLRGFFNLSRLATESRPLSLPVALIDQIMRFLPARFWGTALSPYLVVLLRKAVTPEARIG